MYLLSPKGHEGHDGFFNLLQLTTARAEVVRLEGVRLGLESQCSRYESQLHRVQAQMVEEMDGKERTIDKLRAEMEKYKVQCIIWLATIRKLVDEKCVVVHPLIPKAIPTTTTVAAARWIILSF